MRLGGSSLLDWPHSELSMSSQRSVLENFHSRGWRCIDSSAGSPGVGVQCLGTRRVVGNEGFTLNDRKINLDLVEPAGVDWGVYQSRLGALLVRNIGGRIEQSVCIKPNRLLNARRVNFASASI